MQLDTARIKPCSQEQVSLEYLMDIYIYIYIFFFFNLRHLLFSSCQCEVCKSRVYIEILGLLRS